MKVSHQNYWEYNIGYEGNKSVEGEAKWNVLPCECDKCLKLWNMQLKLHVPVRRWIFSQVSKTVNERPIKNIENSEGNREDDPRPLVYPNGDFLRGHGRPFLQGNGLVLLVLVPLRHVHLHAVFLLFRKEIVVALGGYGRNIPETLHRKYHHLFT